MFSRLKHMSFFNISFFLILLYVYNFYYTMNDLMIFLKKYYYINNDLFLFGLPGVMIIVKLWVHTSVKWKLSWGWESHCVVSISRDPNSSSNLSKVLGTQTPEERSQICPINPLVCQNLPLWPPAISDGKTYKSSLTVFLNKHQKPPSAKKNI